MESQADTAESGHRLAVKICGITNPADAESAVALGADMLGFNFYPGSRRCITLDEARAWLPEIPAGVRKVAVLVNQTDLGRQIFEAGLVDALQLHGDEDVAACKALRAAGIPFVKALRVSGADSLTASERFGTAEILLDAFHPGAYGGTGQRLDWSLAAQFVAEHRELRVLLSGGLTPGNVAEAVRRVRPAAVDVASGVETPGDPRRKDRELMREFILAARG